MRKFSLIVVLSCLVVASFGRAQQPSSPPANPVITGSVLKVADQIKLPAKEPGVLVQLAVKEGSQVRAGQVIGKIDDSEPQMKKLAANAEYAGAYNRWKEDIEIRFAQAQAEVAKADYEQLKAANLIAAKSIAEVELRKAKLDWDHFILAIEK